VLEVHVLGAWAALYRFGDEEHLPADYEVANWYTSTHPESQFLKSLMVARVVPDARYSLMNRSLTTYRCGGVPERRTLGSPAEIRAVLESVFGIVPPAAHDLDAVLERLGD
jgi:N-hydroxyarylamine O-acetyltransferase